MKFEYRLSGLGWADGVVEVDSRKCYFTTSYLTDALNDLLKAIISITPSCVPFDELRLESAFQFYAEPSGTEWVLKRVNDDLIFVQIVSFSDIDHKMEPVREMEFEMPFIDFVGSVVKELDLLIKTHGLVGFRECWYEHDFPLTSFLKLKNYYITQEKYEVNDYEEKGCSLIKTAFEKDAHLLIRKI